MVFIIDENITPEAVKLFRSHHLEAHHVNDLKSSKHQRIVDDQLRRLSIQKGYVIVTKDDDFIKSFVDRKVPEKLIFLFGGKAKGDDLLQIQKVTPLLPSLLKTHDFVEVGMREIRFPFSD